MFKCCSTKMKNKKKELCGSRRIYYQFVGVDEERGGGEVDCCRDDGEK